MCVPMLQVSHTMAQHFDLLLHHRRPPGKMVMFPHFPGQFFQLGVGHRLGSADGCFISAGRQQIAEDHPHQRQHPRDDGRQDRFVHHIPPFLSSFHK